MNVNGTPFRTVWWESGRVRMIDQPLLPHQFRIVDMPTYEHTALAIRAMTVRGAGAIGATGALGMAQAAVAAPEAEFHAHVAHAANHLRETRPTAQNLFAGIDFVLRAIEAEGSDVARSREAAVAAANAFADDDAESCRRIGELGAPIVSERRRVSTHCNAGWLAFVDWGSALSPIYSARRAGADVFVWVDETRPRQQGSQLTAWELGQEGVPHAVIADNATGHYMARGEIDVVIVGSDRIAANGDVANKIGTYTSALAAAANGIPFYVAAPTTTIARHTATGADIPIEERGDDEVLYAWGWSDDGRFMRVRTAPVTSRGRNPAFDVTPAALIAGIITEKGIVPASVEGIASVAR
ncbi:MAG: S-methyl-5-thioribose-1-phosphate isomerase [Deltaproteobacteria bacterium]|nr:S-methyl-5-thioribose-1-phosphate isomerase [Deltaproteobacteria bacterium]